MHFHWQNLTEQPDPRLRGLTKPLAVHGRAWFRFFDEELVPSVQVEWLHGSWTTQAVLTIDRDERSVQVALAIPGFSYYVIVEGLPARWIERLPFMLGNTDPIYDDRRREIGVRVHDGKIWGVIWAPRDHWSSRHPPWMRFELALPFRSFLTRMFGDPERRAYQKRRRDQRKRA